MKRTISKWIGIAAMAGAIAFSLIQVRTPVVRANGCPDNPFPECVCTLSHSVSAQSGDLITTTCTYNCNCSGFGGDGNHFYIEKDYSYCENCVG